MKKAETGILAGLIVGALLFSQASIADTGWVKATKISVITTTHDSFGNCAAKLKTTNDSLNCSKWVTFDCTGALEGNSKTAGNRKFNVAQLAYAADRIVRVLVTDDKKINGMCFASRLDLQP